MSEAQRNDSVSQPSDEQPSEQEPSSRQPLVDFIRERPWVCVLGATALGFLLARLVRGER
jgi:ElaB/YqjD/DUF883 family membrane-anchored ribosome-binding protein